MITRQQERPVDAVACELELLRHALNRYGRMQMRANGACMRPLINRATRFELAASDSRTLRIGTVICYQRHGNLFAHRIVCRLRRGETTRYLTKGDSSPRFDPIVEQSQIIGVVTRFEVDGRWHELTQGWRHRMRFLATMLSPLAPIAIALYRQLIR